MIRFQWVGGPTFLLRAGSFRLLADPVFAEGADAFRMNGHPSTGRDDVPIARRAPLPALELDGLDVVVVSHLHSDHFDAAARTRLPRGVRVVAPRDQAERVREWGFEDVHGVGWGCEVLIAQGEETLLVHAVPARHAHADELNDELGVVNGYLIRYRAPGVEWTLYWTGDTVWFPGMEEIRRAAGAVDLLVPHMGAVGVDGPFGRMTLDAEEGTRLIELFRPGVVIPIHHHTFSHYVEPVEALLERAAGTGAALVALREGEGWTAP